MPRALLLLSVCVLGLGSLGAAPATRPAPATAPATAPSNKLTLTGKLESGIMAIGGETTGTEITSGGTRYELDIKDAVLKRKAEELNGKDVTVTGTLTIRQGVERGQRRIVAVETLAAK